MFDAERSQDLAIRHLVRQHQELTLRCDRLSDHLREYAAHNIVPLNPSARVPLQEHYNMLDQENCGCDICTDWALRRDEFARAVHYIPTGHKWSVCACDACRFVGRFQLNLLAAANRRELLIEMSFHARFHSRHGALVMNWTVQEIAKPSYTDNWCAQEMNRFPMERWLQRCENAVSGAASGKVFVNSTMRTDMYTPFNSSLTADIDTSAWFH